MRKQAYALAMPLDYFSAYVDIEPGIARVNRPIEGDQVLTLGDVEVQALYMPFSHSHTLYGFHLPQHGVVYAPHMMFVRMVPPWPTRVA